MHLGAHSASDVLRDPATRRPLLDALRSTDRLVLLGDLVELRHGPLRAALGVAAPALSEIGDALGPDGEVVILAGNHDHYLLEDWSRARASHGPPPAFELETEVEIGADGPLAHIAGLLAPARVRAAYPGLWLGPGIYATHGHYLDLHLTVPTLERLGAAVMSRTVGLDGAGPHRAEDYEMVLVPMYRWIHAVAQLVDPARAGRLGGGSVRGWSTLTGPQTTLKGRATALAFPLAIGALNRARLGPLRPELTGEELRRAGLRAMSEVVARLNVRADHVLFGHTHRAGPLPGDDQLEWCTVAGTRLINTGCWVREEAFLRPDPSRSPYRPGFAVTIDDDRPPRLVNLLD